MSTSTLRELVEAIKTQGKVLAGGQGASAATARDLVYLSTSVERLFGADAILELVDSAAKPVEVVSAALATTQAVELTVDQVTKTVIKFSLVRSGIAVGTQKQTPTQVLAQLETQARTLT